MPVSELCCSRRLSLSPLSYEVDIITPIYRGRWGGLAKSYVFFLFPSQLEAGHSGRLEKTEDLWLKVRKDHAPRLARLSLESRSLQDVLLHRESLSFPK